jgi:hypothetical protein
MKKIFSERTSNGDATFKHAALIVLDEELEEIDCLGSDQRPKV